MKDDFDVENTDYKGYLQELARQGGLEAQLELAEALFHGDKEIGISKDRKMGLAWLKKAAMGRHPQACLLLGTMLAKGEGMAKDPPAAYRHFVVAVEQGEARAITPLALCLLFGEGVKRDVAQAVRLLREAARLPVENGYYFLSAILKHGLAPEIFKGETEHWIAVSRALLVKEDLKIWFEKELREKGLV